MHKVQLSCLRTYVLLHLLRFGLLCFACCPCVLSLSQEWGDDHEAVAVMHLRMPIFSAATVMGIGGFSAVEMVSMSSIELSDVEVGGERWEPTINRLTAIPSKLRTRVGGGDGVHVCNGDVELRGGWANTDYNPTNRNTYQLTSRRCRWCPCLQRRCRAEKWVGPMIKQLTAIPRQLRTSRWCRWCPCLQMELSGIERGRWDQLHSN